MPRLLAMTLLAACSPRPDDGDPRWAPYRGCEATIEKTYGGALTTIEQRIYDDDGNLVERVFDQQEMGDDQTGAPGGPPDGTPDTRYTLEVDDQHRLLVERHDTGLDGEDDSVITWTYDGDATIAAMLDYDYRADGTIDERFTNAIELDDAAGRTWVESWDFEADGTIESRDRHTETFRDDGLIVASTNDDNADGTVYSTTEFTYDGTELARRLMVAADQHVIADDRWTWRRGRPVRVESLAGSQPRFEKIDWTCR